MYKKCSHGMAESHSGMGCGAAVAAHLAANEYAYVDEVDCSSKLNAYKRLSLSLVPSL
jgi:hypothetical protein